MAACIWLGRIHRWHDGERLGRRGSRFAKHHLDQRGAPGHRRHCRSIATEAPGRRCHVHRGSASDRARSGPIAAPNGLPSHAHHRGPNLGKPRPSRYVCGDPLESSRHGLTNRRHPLVRVGVVGGGGLSTDWTTASAAIRPRRRVRFGCGRWSNPMDGRGIHHLPVRLGLVQPLHGLTFALLHLACMRLIVQVMPIRLAATAQSIYGTLCVGLTTALLTLASGVMYEQMGGHAFLVMAALLFVGTASVHGLRPSSSGVSQTWQFGSHRSIPKSVARLAVLASSSHLSASQQHFSLAAFSEDGQANHAGEETNAQDRCDSRRSPACCRGRGCSGGGRRRRHG